MTPRMTTSPAGLALIKSFEGFRARAARLSNGGWVVGHGHSKSAREGVVVNAEQADSFLKYDLQAVEAALNDWCHAPLLQNEFDALASFVFNIGLANFRTSEVLRCLNRGEPLHAAAAMDPWRKARINGRAVVVDSLVRRRAVERALFLDHPTGRASAPTPVLPPEIDLALSIALTPTGEPAIRFDTRSDDEAASNPFEPATDAPEAVEIGGAIPSPIVIRPVDEVPVEEDALNFAPLTDRSAGGMGEWLGTLLNEEPTTRVALERINQSRTSADTFGDDLALGNVALDDGLPPAEIHATSFDDIRRQMAQNGVPPSVSRVRPQEGGRWVMGGLGLLGIVGAVVSGASLISGHGPMVSNGMPAWHIFVLPVSLIAIISAAVSLLRGH
jgi:GH24 family phage-related lysozyme (muramidase)